MLTKAHRFPLLFLLVLLPVSSDAQGNTYDLGAFPYLSARQMIEAYGPITKHLSKVLGKSVRLRSASNFVKYSQNLESEVYDIAVIQPFDYPEATKKYHYIALVRVDEPLVTTFMVRQDSPLNKLSDLKGKKLAFPPKSAANSRMARAELAKAGLISSKDALTITYQNSHDSCLHDVLIGRAVACPSAGAAIRLFEQKRKVKLRALASTPAIPHVTIVAHERLPQNERQTIQAAFIALRKTPNGRKILQGLHFPGFVQALDKDYEVLMAYVQPEGTASPISQKSTHAAMGTTNVLSLGIFPYLSPKRLAELIAPIPESLSNALDNATVRFKTTSDYSKFVENLKKAEYDIALVQPFDVQSAIKAGYIPVAQMSKAISTAIYARHADDIKGLKDLKGKTIAAPPREAAVSRLLLAELDKQGLLMGRDIAIHFRRSHYACMEQLQLGLVSACATAPVVYENMVQAAQKKDLQKIFETKSIPGVMFMIKKQLPENQVSAIKQTIINWHTNEAGRSLLKQAGFSSFKPANIADYKQLNAKFKEP